MTEEKENEAVALMAPAGHQYDSVEAAVTRYVQQHCPLWSSSIYVLPPIRSEKKSSTNLLKKFIVAECKLLERKKFSAVFLRNFSLNMENLRILFGDEGSNSEGKIDFFNFDAICCFPAKNFVAFLLEKNENFQSPAIGLQLKRTIEIRRIVAKIFSGSGAEKIFLKIFLLFQRICEADGAKFLKENHFSARTIV